MSWPVVRLGDVTVATSGSTPPRGRPDYFAGPVPWAKIQDLTRSGMWLRNTDEGVTMSAVRDRRLPVFQPGTVLLAMYGSIGAVSIAGIPTTANQAILGISPNERLDAVFLWFFLRHRSSSLARLGRGGTQSNINASIVRDLRLPLPSVEEQRRIAAMLKDQFDILRVLEAASIDKAAYLAMLRSTATSAPFVLESAAGVEARTIGSIARIQSGYAFQSEWFRAAGVRLLRNANVGHRQVDWTDTAHLDAAMEGEFEAFQLHHGDIVLSLDRPLISTGIKVARLTESDIPSLLLQRVARLLPNGSVDPEYLFAFLLSSQFRESVSGHDQSLGIPHISPRQVGAVELALPSIEEQRRIATELRRLVAKLDAIDASVREEHEAIEALPAALLRRAFEERTA